MKGKRLVLFISVLSLVFPAQADYKRIRKGLDKVEYYSKAFLEEVKNGTFDTTKDNLDGLGNDFEVMQNGLIEGLKMVVYKKPPNANETVVSMVKHDLVKVGKMLDKNVFGIKQCSYKPKSDGREVLLRDKLNAFDSLALFFRRMVSRGDQMSIADFVGASYGFKLRQRPQWLVNELKAPNLVYAKDSIIEEGNNEEVICFYQQILSLFFPSIILDVAYFTTQYQSSDAQTFKKYRNERVQDVHFYLHQIIEALDTDIALQG